MHLLCILSLIQKKNAYASRISVLYAMQRPGCNLILKFNLSYNMLYFCIIISYISSYDCELYHQKMDRNILFKSCICHKFDIGYIFQVLNEWSIITYKNLENIGVKLYSIDPFFKFAASKINIYSRYGHSKYFTSLRLWIRFIYALFWS